MANEPRPALVLRDAAGHYYLLPEEVVESARVPDGGKAEIDRRLAGDDVTGLALLAQRPSTGIIANGMEILGIAWGGPTMVRSVPSSLDERR
ncbi:MAG: hypothetical protein AB7R89_34625 [Dehalococcoidia bacterium]